MTITVRKQQHKHRFGRNAFEILWITLHQYILHLPVLLPMTLRHFTSQLQIMLIYGKKEAITGAINTLKRRDTWKLVDRRQIARVLRNKFILTFSNPSSALKAKSGG
jgi:hypothetical protein